MEIFFDSIQEGIWFRSLHPKLNDAILSPFPLQPDMPELLSNVLAYDKPDIVLKDQGKPILVIERTIEVPSGHNVGQRFARLAAAAQMRIPVVYFGPYAAYKHGGSTQGPRYMNLRLFQALKNLASIEKAAVSTINWPVDEGYEIIQNPSKDIRMKDYLALFFDLYPKLYWDDLIQAIKTSEFEQEQEAERKIFISTHVVNPAQYDDPPSSVSIGHSSMLPELHNADISNLKRFETVLYKIGMRYIRPDPYTGMSILYLYLYCSGMRNRTRNLVLHFPKISKEKWQTTAKSSPERKDIKLFRLAADGILFSDGYLPKSAL